MATVSGAAFAQSTVNLTGGIAYGHQATKTSDVKDSGFGMDTAAIKLSVTEDLGGGLKATGSISAGGLARGNAVTGEDMSLVVAGGFGSVLLGQIEIGSGIRGLAQAGAPVNNMEGEVLGAASPGTDIVKYTAPAMNGLTFSGSLTEDKGLATGFGPATKGTSAMTVGVDFANGPLSAKLDYSDWSSKAAAGKADNRIRVAGKYDLGMVAIGAGFDSSKLVGGGTNNFTMFGVSAPLGAFTVGAALVTNDISTTAGSKTGSTFGVSYALSKRTSLTANVASWEISEDANAAKNSKTTILLNHSF